MKKNVDGHLKIGYTTIASMTCTYLQIGRIIGGKANITGRVLYDDIQGFDSPIPNENIDWDLFCSIRFLECFL